VREYLVPSEEGMHRVNWDLRHPVNPLSELEAWVTSATEGLPRNIGNRGHFVSPGSYTVTLAARGTTISETVEVRGDPEMPLTQAQYEERESFLSGVLALQVEFTRIMGPGGGGRGGRQQMEGMTETQRALAQHRRNVGSVYQALNGGGVRQGSLYPPTQSQRERVEAARAALAERSREGGLEAK
jgi:hypothetical protein